MRHLYSFLKLFRGLILRPLIKDFRRTALTVLGVALGVSVFLSIQLANRQTLHSFKTSLDLVLGKADAIVYAEGMPFDENHFAKLLPLRKWIKAYPVIEGYGVESQTGETVEILGTDLLQDSGIRDFSLKTIKPDLSGLLPLLLDPKSIILPEKFIPDTHFQAGNEIEFLIDGQTVTLNVNAVLENKGLAKALNGNFALMDIAAAQSVFGKIGKLDRIDIEFIEKVDFHVMREKIAEVLPAFLRIDRPERKNQQIEKMLRAFQYNLTALSFIALLVGLYLIYNMVSLSVVRRRQQIGTLRALGTPAVFVGLIFILEAGVIGSLGSLIGVPLGHGLAQFSLSAIVTTIDNLYLPADVDHIDFNWNQAGPYFVLGVGLALFSAWLPAQDAAKTSPTLVMRQGSYDLKIFRGNLKQTFSGFGVLLLAAVFSTFPKVNHFPYFGFLSVALLILGMSLLVPSLLLLIRKHAKGYLKKYFQAEGLLAGLNLTQNIGRNAIAISSLAIAFMMVISMSIMVHSFRQTVVIWIEQTLKADLFVRAIAQKNIDYQHTLPIDAIDSLKKIPGIQAIDLFRAIDISYEDEPAILASGDFQVLSSLGNLVIKDGAEAKNLADAMVGKQSAIVSEAFALKHKISLGSQVTIQTPKGPLTLTIVSIYYDYSQERGYLIVDRGTYLKYYEDPNVNSFVVYLKESASVNQVRKQVNATLSQKHKILIRSNQEIKAEVLRIFDKTFAITYALEIIGVGVALLGLFNTLVSLILERRREIGCLRFLGAYKEQIKKMVLIESALFGALGASLGLAAGVAVSYLLIFVINKQSFGWTIQVFFPYAYIVIASLLFLLSAILIGIYPARMAANYPPQDILRAEG